MPASSEAAPRGAKLAAGAAPLASAAGRTLTLTSLSKEDASEGAGAVAAGPAHTGGPARRGRGLRPPSRGGKEIGVSLAGLLDCGIIGEVKALKRDASGFLFTRGLFGGRFEAQVRGKSERGVALVLPHALEG